MTPALGIGKETAEAWAGACVAALSTPFPYASGHVSLGPDDLDVNPFQLHPAFHGCLDWHSSCHMQWSLLQLRPALGRKARSEVDELLDDRLNHDAIQVEVGYVRRHPSFERPYGWVWALMLAAAARDTRWETAVAPLAHHLGAAVLAWLPTLPLPVRHGVHGNTALALLLGLRAASGLGMTELEVAIRHHARRLYGDDKRAGWEQEPSAHDFLSPSLTEATLMAEVLDDPSAWLTGFLEGVTSSAVLQAPPDVTDADGQLAHLGGLAISRSWLLRRLSPHVPPHLASQFTRSANAQYDAVVDRITSGDFMSTHWLVTFALLATESGPWTN